MKIRTGAPTRREVVASAVAAALVPRILKAQPDTGPHRLASDPERPQFHLLPAKNWMNDPNGPVYFGGKYHMFFQYNPHGAVWGDMSWNHAVSADMIHWTHLPVAMTPTPGSADAFGCFSGSAIPVGKRVYMIYTGTVQSTPELATLRDGHSNLLETQCLAWSDDADLARWTKLPRPVIARTPPGMKVTGFRDPSVWQQGGWHYLAIGSGVEHVGGCILLYRSKDLESWEYLHPLTSGEWTGKPASNPCDNGEMWECPDFFALDGGHVLIYSTMGKVFWQSGDLDAATMKFTARKTGLLDLDAFYAPKTQLDAHGRRILWGWIPERRSDDEMRKAGWSGMMSLPRVMNLEKDGSLRLTILPESSVLRKAAPAMTLPAACGEFLHSAPADCADFQLVLRGGAQELFRAKYIAGSRSFEIDGHSIPVSAGRGPELHGFVDGSVVEVIVNGSVGNTKRFYYEQERVPDVVIGLEHASGAHVGSTQVWAVAPISADRLTTPAHM